MAIATFDEEFDVVTAKVEPPKWSVIVHNDDVTPIDFVIEMLEYIFHHSTANASNIAREVHETGKAIAGTFCYAVAEQKIFKTQSLVNDMNMVLQVTLQQH